MEELKRHLDRMKFHIGKLEVSIVCYSTALFLQSELGCISVLFLLEINLCNSQVCMRMVNNESLESKRVMDVLKDPLEMYVDALVDPDYEGDTDHLENLDPEGAFC